jgi:hypothetical protein
MKHTLTLLTTLIASASLHAAPETNVDHLVQTDAKPVLAAPLVALEKMLAVDGTHLIVPVSAGTEELRADAPAFLAEIARCFRSKGCSSIPPFGILRFLLFKKIVANMSTFCG